MLLFVGFFRVQSETDGSFEGFVWIQHGSFLHDFYGSFSCQLPCHLPGVFHPFPPRPREEFPGHFGRSARLSWSPLSQDLHDGAAHALHILCSPIHLSPLPGFRFSSSSPLQPKISNPFQSVRYLTPRGGRSVWKHRPIVRAHPSNRTRMAFPIEPGFLRVRLGDLKGGNHVHVPPFVVLRFDVVVMAEELKVRVEDLRASHVPRRKRKTCRRKGMETTRTWMPARRRNAARGDPCEAEPSGNDDHGWIDGTSQRCKFRIRAGTWCGRADRGIDDATKHRPEETKHSQRSGSTMPCPTSPKPSTSIQ